MSAEIAVLSEAPWKTRFNSLLDRLPEGQEIEIDRLVVRVNPPSVSAMSDEIVRRAIQGSLLAVYRVFSPETRIPLRDFSLDVRLPTEIEDDTVGETVKLDMRKDVELIVSKSPARTR